MDIKKEILDAKAELEARYDQIKESVKGDLDKTQLEAKFKLNAAYQELKDLLAKADSFKDEQANQVLAQLATLKMQYGDAEDKIEAKYKGFLAWIRRVIKAICGN
jgi:hypothetical protein